MVANVSGQKVFNVKDFGALKKGGFVIMQFGHNDGSAPDDTTRARGTIKGTGEESKEIHNPTRMN